METLRFEDFIIDKATYSKGDAYYVGHSTLGTWGCWLERKWLKQLGLPMGANRHGLTFVIASQEQIENKIKDLIS